MKIWLIRASEPMPVVDGKDRLFRMGLLGEKLSERKNDVTWFASTFNHFKKIQYSNKDSIIKISDNYRLNLINTPSYKKNISISRILNHKVLSLKFRQKIKKLESPDLLFASFPTIEMAYEAVKYGIKRNIPVVIDVRDLWPETFKQNLHGILRFISSPFIWYLNKKTKYIMKNCYSITSISELMLEWALKKGNRKKTPFDAFFYIGYKSNLNEVESTSNLQNLVDKRKFNICFFATINNQFNYDLIINVAKKLKKEDINIIISGDGPNLSKFKMGARNINNIKFLGWQNKECLSYILNNSDIGFAPYKDTFDFQMSVSNKFAEYLSYGLPIAITSSGYMKSLVDTYNIGIATENVDKLCEFFINVKNDKKKKNIMSKNANKLYKKFFDANLIYNEMAKFLEKICKECNE